MLGEKYEKQNISTILRVWECWGVTELNIRIV